jgi:hypothetical protein
VPVGLAFITALLFLLAGINLLTKKTATISGAIFTLVFFTGFTLSEKYHKPEEQKAKQSKPGGIIEEGEIERFRLRVGNNLSPETLHVRPGNVLVAVNDPDGVNHLQQIMTSTDPKTVDVVVLSVNARSEEITTAGNLAEKVVDDDEMRVFSKVVHIAEKAGKPASLVAIPGEHPYSLILQAAQKLRSSRVVISASSSKSLIEQQREIEQAWEQIPGSRHKVLVEILGNTNQRPIQISLESA